MRLEDIGFYTLSDERARNAGPRSALQRCELILTDRCNFKCPYCRGLSPELSGDLSLKDAKKTLYLWALDGLRNVRFSGGEPTAYEGLKELVELASELVLTGSYSPEPAFQPTEELSHEPWSPV